MKTDISGLLPIGTILSYAGAINKDSLKKSGWLYCDGESLNRTEYEDLFNSISTNYGSDSPTQFNVPDLRGVFIRGTSGTSNHDPNSGDRTCLLKGGATGNNPGSYQNYATAKPINSFTATIECNNIIKRKVDAGCNVADSGDYGSKTTQFTDGSGGDLETRPKNKYIYYIIKYTAINQYEEYIIPPIGSVIPFSGINIPFELTQHWLLCNGAEMSTRGYFSELYEVIGKAHGSPEEYLFNLPNYSDYFLRGVSDDSGRDPNVEQRVCSLIGGNSGNNVGSQQECATAHPMNAFGTTIPGLPTKIGDSIISGTVKEAYIWNKNVTYNINVASGGGDLETRPRNYRVDYYIRFR